MKLMEVHTIFIYWTIMLTLTFIGAILGVIINPLFLLIELIPIVISIIFWIKFWYPIVFED